MTHPMARSNAVPGRCASRGVWAALAIVASASASALPSVKIGTASLLSPSQAEAFYPATTQSTNGLNQTTYPNEIVELARALNNNVDLIYEFVRNNVENAWMYGLQKGAAGALVDRSGTAFDQAKLMVDLLRQSGYTASYQVGTITLTGAQFAQWSGVTNATAACQLLSSGSIPAAINGSTIANCSYGTATVSTITLDHAWVSVTIGGASYVFDPSYKAHTFKAGVNLVSIAQLPLGTTVGLATAGATTSTVSSGGVSIPFMRQFNAAALNTALTTYGTNLLTYVNQNLPAGEIEDLVGGGEIVPFVTPVGGQRLATLPYPNTVLRSWSGNVPDPYRTTLNVQLTALPYASNTYASAMNVTLFADEIAARQLLFDGGFQPNATLVNGSLKVVDEAGAEVIAATAAVAGIGSYNQGTLTLIVTHPYAAAGDGSANATGGYMTTSVVPSLIDYRVPFTIVQGWGDISRHRVEKFGTRIDSPFPTVASYGAVCEICASGYFASMGDAGREQLAVQWLAQSSRAARLHAAIASSVYTHHHSLGVVVADIKNLALPVFDPGGGSNTIYLPNVADKFDRLHVESAFSLTSTTGDAGKRRAAVLAIAATSEALEGSVAAQVHDLPDTTSTATRFEWGNLPPVAEDPYGTGPRPFYDFSNATTGAQAGNLATVEGATVSSNPNGYHPRSSVGVLGREEFTGHKNDLSITVSDYAAAGFDVVASGESFLGPGQRASAFIAISAPTLYDHYTSFQRGVAAVATRYVNLEPVEIAHLVGRRAKGGGGGAQTVHQAQYDPSTAADILKARFVDRSNVLGVDLQSGSVSYSSPASLSVGSGGFPYELSASLAWVGGTPQTELFGPVAHTQPPVPWTTNWNSTLNVSGSGLEMMGDKQKGSGDLRASVSTIAAFIAQQDVYRGSPSIGREVVGVLVGSWWVRQLTGNVVTATIGTSSRQFVRLVNNTWIATGPGPVATLGVTGSRSPIATTCGSPTPSYVLTRGWDYSSMAFTVTNAGQDQQKFSYWAKTFLDDTSTYCANLHGFRLSQWTFPQGVTVNLTYAAPATGALDELISVQNNVGRQLNFVASGRSGFNNNLLGSDARSVSVVVPNTAQANTVIHTDPSGNQTKVVGSRLGMGNYQRYALSQVFTADNAAKPNLQFSYDSLRRVQTASDGVTLQSGNRNPHSFFLADELRSDRVDPTGGQYTVYYNRHKDAIGYINELGYTSAATYDGRGRVTSYTYPEGDQDVLAYDVRNNVTTRTRNPKPGSPLAPIVVKAQWNATCNKPDWIIDGNQNRTDFVYYAIGGTGACLLNTATRPSPDGVAARPVYAFTYNSYGMPLQLTDPTGVVTLNAYGTTAELQSTTLNPSGINATTYFGYDANGNVTSIEDARQIVTEKQYDNNRRTTVTLHHDGRLTAPLIAAERTSYDAVGRPYLQEAGTAFSGATTVSTWQTLKHAYFTPTGKLDHETDGAGDLTQYAYDGMDRVTLVTDPVGRRVATVYDAAGEVLDVWRGWDSATSLPTAATAWNPTAFTGRGRIRYAQYTYSLNGQKLTEQDANGNRTSLNYDGFDRLSQLSYPSPTLGSGTSSGTDYEAFTYDANGNRKSFRRRDGQTITFDYDAMNRQTAKHLPNTATGDVYAGYDAADRPAYAHYVSATGSGVDYTYDTAGRLKTEKTFGQVLTYGYDGDGNRTQLTWPDNTFVNYDYDSLNRVHQIRENGATSGAGILAVYNYDPLSRRSTITRGNGTSTTYANYDLASRVGTLTHDLAGTAQDVTSTFGYTLASQLQTRNVNNPLYMAFPVTPTRAYVPDGLNRYASVAGTTYSYDGRGNLTSDGTRTFTYDIENHLLTESGGVAPLTLSYDPTGRLYQTVSGTTTTRFLYDGPRLTMELSSANAVLRRYVHGPGTDEPVVWYEGSGLGTRTWLHGDERGSIVATSDTTGAGTVYPYGPYGEPGVWNGSRFKYTGQIALPEANLYYYKARVYDPVMGRFLQTDPIGSKDDLALYTYVGNDPLDKTDPSGETCVQNDDKKGMTCKVDDPGKLSAKEVTKVNKAYTAAVNKLLSHPNQTVKVTVNGKSAEYKAGDLAKGLASTKVIGGDSTDARASTVGGPLAPTSASGGVETTVDRLALQQDRSGGTNSIDTDLRKTFIHEAMHGNSADAAFKSQFNADPNKFNDDHRVPYNDASSSLYDGPSQ